MKEFMKMTLAVIVGSVILSIFSGIMYMMMIVSLMMSGNSSTAVVLDNSVLHVKLIGTLDERSSEEMPFASLMGNDVIESLSLEDLKLALLEAAQNDDVKGVYLEAGVLGSDFASLQEARKALLDFKKSGKFIVAYGDQYSQSAYYLASVADRVLLNPDGMIDWHGLASQPIFYKDLLEKIGVKYQVFKVGTYKSAVEPFILTGMSDANREQVTSFINDIWGVMLKDVAQSRKLTTDTLNAYADRYVLFEEPKQYVAQHLADSLCYIDGTRDVLRQKAGGKKINLISTSDLASLYKPSTKGDKVAVYYACGNIVDEVASTSFTEGDQIVGSKVVEDLDELMNDDEVKAVVLRINSGGGSAYASEQMWRAIQLLKKKKPVVVSMSGMAASGGYYMSCGADYIFADATTITGSIGIFGLMPEASTLLTQKLGLHFDVVKTNEAADFGGTMAERPFNEKESAAMQAYVERGYQLFISRVAAGRKMTTAQVDSIGQGRVWTGQQALGIHLVDKIGTLEDAIAYAASRAKLSSHQTVVFPAKAAWYENFLDDVKEDTYMSRDMKLLLGDSYQPLLTLWQMKQNRTCLQARMPFELNIK